MLQVFSTYRFTFDHVYAHDAAQADVYMNSARESVLNALQVRPHLALHVVLGMCRYAACRMRICSLCVATHHDLTLTFFLELVHCQVEWSQPKHNLVCSL